MLVADAATYDAGIVTNHHHATHVDADAALMLWYVLAQEPGLL